MRLRQLVPILFTGANSTVTITHQDTFDSGSTPGVRASGYTVTDTNSYTSLSGGALQWTNVTGTSDPSVVSPTVTKAAGMIAAWDATLALRTYASIGSNKDNGWLFEIGTASANVRLNGRLISIASESVMAASAGKYAIGWDGTKSYFFQNDGSGWQLRWVGGGITPTSIGQRIDTVATSGLRDVRKMAIGTDTTLETGNVFRADNLSSISAGNTLTTTTGDWFCEVVVTTVPSSGDVDIRFRQQDANNYWQLLVKSTGDLELNEVVGGSATLRASSAGVIASGDELYIRCEDETITVWEGAPAGTINTQINYTSASNFKSETGLEFDALGTGGALDDANIFEYTGVIDRSLDRMLS